MFSKVDVEVLHMMVQSHIAYSLNLSVAPAVVPVATISTILNLVHSLVPHALTLQSMLSIL